MTFVSAIFLAVGGFLFGYDSGIISSSIILPNFEEYFSKPNDDTVGGIVSSFQGGAVLGTMINMVRCEISSHLSKHCQTITDTDPLVQAFANMLGRKRTILIGSLVSLLGSSLQAGAVNIGMLIAGRFIGGVAVGQLTSTIPMYASELSMPKYRGALSGLLQWFLSWGFFVAQWLGYGCSFNSGQFSCE